ncbi:hypothetical protein BGZ54_006174 [Gamsiella multidivaricata]|nr:hypothetical protein BGZ54_006174 [Gamsiella multidivaricata]
MIADSNTLAVGTWYLSALGVTFLGYTSMFIYYMNKPNDVFSPQAQALDLCIRLTACPIFSLPPPQFLLRYFHAKYGSTVRDDNPHTMIEEGITNDPRPRRPPMLVSQPTSYNSRREHDYDFDYPSIHERHSLRFQSPYSALDDDDRCRRYIEEETNIGTTSSLGTAADTSPKLNPHSAGSTLKQDDTHMPPSIGVADDAVLSALSITLPPTVHHPTPIKGESLSPISPFSFAPGVLLARGEEEETAIAARRISRRLTMEGRKDGLDFLNISGLMKWPHRPNSAIPATKSRVTGSTNSSSALPTTTSGTNFLKASRRHSDTPERNISPSRRAVREKLSMMGGSSLVEEDEAEEDQTWHSRENKDISEKEASHHEPPSRRGSRKDEKLTEPSNTTTTKSAEQYTSVEPSNIRTNVQQLKSHENGRDDLHAHLPAFNVAASEYNGGRGNNTSQSIGKKMSMDKIRRMSRSALTRLQEGGLGAALSIPTTTGPLSPTILHTEHGYPARGERMGPKSLPHAGGDVLISMPPDQQHNDESHGQQNGPIITP